MTKHFRTGLGLALSLLAAPGAAMAQQPMAMPAHVDTVQSGAPIHQEVDFAAPPARIYEALLDQAKFAAFSGRPATLDRAAGGAFTLFGGPITGRNIELIPNQRIVQAWRVANWPDGVWSIVRFELKPQGTGTRLIFDHTGFPASERDHLVAGWETNYWAPLKKYLQ
ncbi:MAG: SRPBCC domain-containing protein [Gemmatimonadales bacterium]